MKETIGMVMNSAKPELGPASPHEPLDYGAERAARAALSCDDVRCDSANIVILLFVVVVLA
jgi:hypothetical protein